MRDQFTMQIQSQMQFGWSKYKDRAILCNRQNCIVMFYSNANADLNAKRMQFRFIYVQIMAEHTTVLVS